MKIKTERFGLPYNPGKERQVKNRLTKHIILFLCLFIVIAVMLALGFEILMRNHITYLAINNTIDSTWIGSLASYWGGIIGGAISGVFAFCGVFFTIRYYKESDEQKEKAAIQPFLLVTVGANKNIERGFKLGKLGPESDEKKATKEIKVTIKNIGNGFAKTLVVHTGLNLGGMAYNKLISVDEAEYLFFMADPDNLARGVCFEIQYIDAMRNEYIQKYSIIENYGSIDIECGYPEFLEQR
jgi:hypothetical protein